MLKKRTMIGLGTMLSLALSGCHLKGNKSTFFPAADGPSVAGQHLAQLRSSNAVPSQNMPTYQEDISPLDLDENSMTPERFLPMTLQDCISQALSNSKVMRDLGVSVIRSPQSINTNLDPAIVYTDPRIGEEAALSAFDANFFVSSMYERNNRRFNNEFFGEFGVFDQDLNTSQFGINKRSSTGGLFSFRNVAVYDRNNQTSNTGPYSWDDYIEAQVRQPLLQGAGTQFNMIAGPGAAPGQYNGVLLARVRTDINLIEFERSVRDYLAEVENAYWDLYYAYRDLEARKQVRDIADETFRKLEARKATERVSELAQAEEQYIRFQSDVVDALNGRAIDGTRTNNGSSGGTFRGTGGVRISERKLRMLIGIPINDGRLIHPTDQPVVAKVNHDWHTAIQEALSLREELRKQRWVIKQRELELIASRNYLKPQLDLVSQYRLRGYGQERLFGSDSALDGVFGGDFQEWQLGVEYQAPIGFRRAHAAVRNAQLALVRESDILREQERAVHLGLSNAMNDAKRAFENLELQEKRLQKIVLQLEAIEKSERGAERSELDVKLETHRRLLDARLRYHQSEVEYMLSLRNVNVEKGTLLRYCNVWLNESSSSSSAVADAVDRIAAQDYSTDPATRAAYIGTPAR